VSALNQNNRNTTNRPIKTGIAQSKVYLFRTFLLLFVISLLLSGCATFILDYVPKENYKHQSNIFYEYVIYSDSLINATARLPGCYHTDVWEPVKYDYYLDFHSPDSIPFEIYNLSIGVYLTDTKRAVTEWYTLPMYAKVNNIYHKVSFGDNSENNKLIVCYDSPSGVHVGGTINGKDVSQNRNLKLLYHAEVLIKDKTIVIDKTIWARKHTSVEFVIGY